MGMITNTLLKAAGGALAVSSAGIGTFYKGGYATRAAIGAAFGGIGAYATNDYNTLTNQLSATAKGAVMGGILGAATKYPGSVDRMIRQNLGKTGNWFTKLALSPFRTTPSIADKLAVNAVRAYTYPLVEGGIAAAKFSKPILKRAGLFAMEHPLATAGIVGGAYGAIQIGQYGKQSFESPSARGSIQTAYQQAAYSGQMETSPYGVYSPEQRFLTNSSNTMRQSTEGLVFGLHRGRHS